MGGGKIFQHKPLFPLPSPKKRGLCFVGTLSTTLAIVQAGWYLWWTQKVHVDAEVSEGE